MEEGTKRRFFFLFEVICIMECSLGQQGACFFFPFFFPFRLFSPHFHPRVHVTSTSSSQATHGRSTFLLDYMFTRRETALLLCLDFHIKHPSSPTGAATVIVNAVYTSVRPSGGAFQSGSTEAARIPA